MDSNGDGTLTVDELRKGASQIPGIKFDENDFNKMLKVLDNNGNGVIDYTEFIAGCMSSYVYLDENNLKAAFQYFDKDGSGKITMDELKLSLQDENLTLDETDLKKLVDEVDTDKDGQIDYEEFIKMMSKQNK